MYLWLGGVVFLGLSMPSSPCGGDAPPCARALCTGRSHLLGRLRCRRSGSGLCQARGCEVDVPSFKKLLLDGCLFLNTLYFEFRQCIT